MMHERVEGKMTCLTLVTNTLCSSLYFQIPFVKIFFIFCLSRTLPPDYKLSLILNL